MFARVRPTCRFDFPRAALLGQFQTLAALTAARGPRMDRPASRALVEARPPGGSAKTHFGPRRGSLA